jgi:hypothetical protein
MITIKKIAAVAGIVALLAPSAAFAQSNVEGYGGKQNVVAGLQEESGGPPPPQAPAVRSQEAAEQRGGGGGGQLPFTGADLGVLAAAGGILAGLGFGLRRLTHRPTAA